MKKKSVNLVFLFLLLAVGCSQETVMNGSISGKTNASDTKMSINIVTETSRTVRPAVTKWEITVTNKEEENNLEYSKTVDSKTTSVTFINIVATATYTVEVHGLDEDENKILSGTKEKVQIEANKVNICNVTVSDDFNTDKSDKNGTLSVNINGLGELGIQENSNFTLEMSGLTKSDENKDVTLSYKDGVLSGRGSDILPGSYKISIADFPVNVIQDPIVNIYPGATTEINRTWNGNKNDVEQNNTLKNTLVPVWNKNADGGDTVGLIGANGLFVTPTWENGTFVACDTDDAGNLWTLTITEKKLSYTDDYGNEVYNYTYKLTNEHTGESYYFTSVNSIEDFAIATLNLDEYLDNSSHEDNEIAAIKEYFKKTEINYLLLLVNGNNEKYIDSCFIKKLPTTKHDTLPAVPSTSYTSCENEEFYCITVQSELSIILSTITAIEVFGKDLYIASRNGTNYLIDDSTIFDRHLNVFANIYKAEISIREIKIETFEDSTIQISNESALYTKSVTEKEDGYYHTPILTLDIGEYFEVVGANSSSDSPAFIKTFLNDAFKISDMYVKGETLYITAGCVNYNSSENQLLDNNNTNDYFSYSFGGLFKYDRISEFSHSYNSEGKELFGSPEGYFWNNKLKKVEGLKIDLVYGLDTNILSADELVTIKAVYDDDNPEYYTFKGRMQAKEEDSQYFAGPRYIIPSNDKLFIIDSGFYGEYEIITDSGDTATTETVIFSLEDRRNRIFTFDINNNNELSFNSITKIDDSISFDYDYITKTENYDEDGTLIPVSW